MGKHFSFPSLFLLEKMKENKKIKRKDEGRRDEAWRRRVNERRRRRWRANFSKRARFMATVIYESRKFEGRTFVESWTITQGQTALQIHDTILSAPASSREWLRLERDHRSWTHVLCLFDDFWNFLYVRLNCGLLLNFNCVVRFLCEIL